MNNNTINPTNPVNPVNPVPSLNKTADFVNNVYDGLGYFDLYGTSVLIFALVTLFVFFVFAYYKVLQNKQAVADDWVNQRCKPVYIPFAGWITKPEGKTAFQYTGENFQFCVQNILLSITSYALQPLQFMIGGLTKTFTEAQGAVIASRQLSSTVRSGVTDIGEDVMNRVLNVVTPVQTMLIAIKDVFQKIQGTMTAGLYTMLGSYYALQSLMDAMLELMIKVLVVLVAIIVGLWLAPFTWPAAASMSAVFLGISIPLAVIIGFMTEVLHVKTSGIPKLRCFDKNTQFKMADGFLKTAENIKVGDMLERGIKIDAVVKVTAEGLKMYDLNGVIVSESHKVQIDEDKWLPVSEHDLAIPIENYREPYLYCFNTSNKQIVLNDIVFSDWDEIYGDQLDVVARIAANKVLNGNGDSRDLGHIHRQLDEGYEGHLAVELAGGRKVPIRDIKVGDKLAKNGYVYGVVEVDSIGLRNSLGFGKLYHLLTTNGYFILAGKVVKDYNYHIDKFFE